MTTTLIRGGAGAGEWQERLCVVEPPHGANTIAAKCGDDSSKVRGEIIGPLLDRSIKGVVVMTTPLHRRRDYHDDVYRSSGMEQRTSAAFSASGKRAKNTPADSTLYPHVYPLKNTNTK
ncbi:hypothetical protein [Pseudomonas sp. RW409]|uniref:hypothetical protein n=1 Tax=Pseudomonas sp. RW409 TaxID=2202895 RepID=UPI0011B6F564|nr:hypothetical protein [Pseudomonas sp. RW409]